MQRKVLVILLLAGTLAAVGVWLWPRQKPHVLLITLDTTRADRLGCYGYERAQTPVLDALAQAGILCEHAYTVAPLTLPAHASLLTGLYPAENGVRTNGRGRLDEAIPTLAEVLRRQGYDTGAFVASFVLDGKFGLDRGFKTYDDDFAGDEPASDALHRQRHGEAVVDAALAWLNEKRSRPFFCWVHLYDPHFPYLTHEDLFGDTFADRPYDAEIAYVDRQVGRLVSFLKSQGLDSRTVVMVVGDHGEGLGEHVERQHGSTLYNTTLHVPLIVCHPGKLAPGGRMAGNVSLVDISPTVLDLAGVADPRKVTGKSFKAGLQGKLAALAPCYGATDEPFLNNGWSPLRSLTDGNWKYIKTTRVELYHLADDPGELNDRAEKEPERTRAMAAQLEAFESRLTLRQEATVQLSPQERRALASLGYAGGTHPEPAGAGKADLPDVKDMLPLDNAVEEAADLVAQGSYDAAIPRLREVIDKAPGHIPAYSFLGEALQKKSDFDAATALFLKLVDVRPESREGYYGLGHVLLSKGRPELAMVQFTKVVEIDPDFAPGHYNLAAIMANLGQQQDSLSHFDLAIDNDPRYAAAYRGRANVLANLGQIGAAVAAWKKSLELDPENCEAHHHLGVVSSDHGQLEDARRHLTRAVELCAADSNAHFALGKFLMQRGEKDAAIQHLQKALELKPGFAAAEQALRQASEPARRPIPKVEQTMQRKVLVILLLAGTLAAVGVWLWPRQKPHVLLITLDTTRADRLGCYGYERAQTPVLDALAQAGILCEHAYTVAPLTLPAHASLLTGLYPAENGVRTNGRGRLDEAIPTLAEVLRRQGYDTGAFVASFVLDGKFGLDRGFKTYDDDFAGDEPASDALHRQRHGEAVVDAALAWLNEKRSRPFFCWVHLYDPHFPYLTHEDLFGDTFADRPYDAEIAYVDRQVGRLVSFLKSQGLDSRTVVMVVGDHGEGLGEHVERQHGSTLYNTTLHVPLIVCHPGKLAPGGRMAGNVSLVDISPTVLDLAGVADPRKVTGKSFKAGLQGKLAALAPCYGATDEPFLNNGWSPLRSLTDGNWKYIKTTRVELYHLADDPGELNDRAEKEPERTRAMAAQLEAFESRLTLRQEATVQLSPQERRALASLGYAGGTHPEPAGAGKADLPDVKDMLPLDNAVEEAADLVAQGSYDAAIPRLREVIEKSPSHSRAYWVLACALRDQKEFDEAATVLLKLLDARPDSREGHYGLGLILLERGRITEGTEELLKALQLDPEFAEAHHDLAMTYMRSGNEEKALAHFGRVLEIDHCHGTAYQWRAFLLARQGNVSAAIADYRKALVYCPDSPHTHHNFGVVLAQTGNHEEAERHLRQAVELSPENAEMQYALGAFLLTRGEAEEAVHCLEKALNLKPDYAAAREELSKARRALKDGQAPGN